MAKVKLQAVSSVFARDASNKMTRYHPGDWFEVGKHRARELIESGQARMLDVQEARDFVAGDMENCGVLVLGGRKNQAHAITAKYPQVEIENGQEIVLPFGRTMLWLPAYPMRPERAALGFARVEGEGKLPRWEAAAMLRQNEILAKNVGNDADKKGTLDLLGTLMLPVYETSAVWVRKTRATEKMVQTWNEWVQEDVSMEHAFLRALYKNRVMLCTLPAAWLATWVPM